MKIEITQAGVFVDGQEVPVGTTIEHDGEAVPSWLTGKARIQDGERVAITNPAQDAVIEPVENSEIEALRAEYQNKAGDEADGRWKASTLRKKLAAL